MSEFSIYIEARWDFLKRCWTSAKQRGPIPVVLVAFGIYHIVAWFQAWAELPRIPLSLPKVPLPWAVAIVVIGITFLVVEGGCRLRQKEFGQEHNLHLEGVLMGSVGSGESERQKLSLCFRNHPKTEDAVGIASVRAVVRWRRDSEIVDVPPLTWLPNLATIDIGAGETAELILATCNPTGNWDWEVSSSGGPADAGWVDVLPFEFDVRLLNTKNGRLFRIQEGLTFRWEWVERAGQPRRPRIVAIEAPEWTRRN
jgi:hypothetical protein